MKKNMIAGILIMIIFIGQFSISPSIVVLASEPEIYSRLPEFEEEVNSILSVVSPSMSDVEKALAVHEYFLLNYDYGYVYDSGTECKSGESYTANGLLVNKVGVCEAYSQAYKYIMEKLDIPCIIVTSNAMNHAWNMISIDGAWYHVDVTWDLSSDMGNGMHMNFLRSDNGITSTGHFGWDGNTIANSTEYDDAFWINTISHICYLDGYWYYVDTSNLELEYQNGFTIINHSDDANDGLIKKYGFKTDTHKTIHTVTRQTYTYKIRGTPYQTKWKGSNTRIAIDNGKIYYNTNDKIYSINPDGTSNALICEVTLADFPLSSKTGIAYIEGIEIKNGTVFYKNSDDGEIYIAKILSTAIPMHTITSSASAGGHISPSGNIELIQNRSRTFIIIEDEEFIISDVLIDGESIGAVSTYTFNKVNENHSIRAIFDSTFTNSGWEVIPIDFEFDTIYLFSEGLGLISKGGKQGFVNTSGKLAIPFTDEYKRMDYFNNGLAQVLKNGKWGCINTFGKLAVPCIYNSILSFSDGMAAVEKDGRWGFINTSGELVIPCIYSNINMFNKGTARVFKGNNMMYINTVGNVVPTPESREEEYFEPELTIVYKDEKCGMINTSGELVVPYIYEQIGPFSDGLAYVSINGKRGYINTSGQLVVPAIYDISDNFSDGLASVYQNGKYGYINTSGELVVPCIYENAGLFRDGVAPVEIDDKWVILKRVLPFSTK